MRAVKAAVKKRFKINFKSTAAIIAAIILAVSTLINAFSVNECFNGYYHYAAEKSTDKTESELGFNGLYNLLSALDYTFEIKKYDKQKAQGKKDILPPEDIGSGLLFSSTAAFENDPYYVRITVAAAVICVWITISSVFSAFYSDRRHFFYLLSAGGASSRQIKAGVFFESLYFCAVGIPLGILTGFFENAAINKLLNYFYSDAVSQYKIHKADFSFRIGFAPWL